MDFLLVPLVVGIVFYFTYKIFRLFACRRERLMLIEKIESLSGKNVDLSGLSLDTDNSNGGGGKFTSLRVGALLLGIGLGMLVGVCLCWAMWFDVRTGAQSITWGTPSIVLGSGVLLFGGLGLVISFIIECRMSNKHEE